MAKLPSCHAQLRHLDEARLLALAGDAEGVHRARTAIRRLRVWLRLGGHRRLEQELRWLGHSLAPVRDLDVLDETLSEAARVAWRGPAVQQLKHALASARWRRLRKEVQRVARPSRREAKKRLAKWEERLRELTDPHPHPSPAGEGISFEALHRLRRLARKVRYAREWLGKKSDEAKHLQQLLGPICDLALLEKTVTSAQPQPEQQPSPHQQRHQDQRPPPR